jgi:hypothetical protein
LAPVAQDMEGEPPPSQLTTPPAAGTMVAVQVGMGTVDPSMRVPVATVPKPAMVKARSMGRRGRPMSRRVGVDCKRSSMAASMRLNPSVSVPISSLARRSTRTP